MIPPSPPPTPARGRPVEINRDHLAMVALRLFEARGFDHVSAAEIATAAGVSRRSLFRYFPTKSDLVWDKFNESLEILGAALLTEQAKPDSTPIGTAVAALGVVADHTQVMSLTRSRLKIIGSNAELFSFGATRLQTQAGILRTFLTEQGIDPLAAGVVSSALTLAAFNGYLWWANDETAEHPAEFVREALASLALF